MFLIDLSNIFLFGKLLYIPFGPESQSSCTIVMSGDIFTILQKTFSSSISITSPTPYKLSLSPIINHAIKEDITSRRANQRAVQSIAKNGRMVRNSEKKKNTMIENRMMFFYPLNNRKKYLFFFV
jgi:hypothetical protein